MPKRLIGRPTKYKANLPDLVLEYIKECEKEEKLPQITELCLKLTITRDTLNRWIKLNSKFSDVIERVKSIQEFMLVQNGIKRKYDPNFAKFILAAHHGYVETSKQINEGQQPVTIQVDMSGGYLPPKATTAPPKPIPAKAKHN